MIKEVKIALIKYFTSMKFEEKRSSLQDFEQNLNIIYLNFILEKLQSLLGVFTLSQY